MHFIDHIIIDQTGFETTNHDCCIYKKLVDGILVYLLRQIDNCSCVCCDQKTTEKVFNTIARKIRFKLEEENGIIPFEFLGVICDYNDVDIKKTSHCIDMSCENYIQQLCRSYDLENKDTTNTDNNH